MGLWHQSIDPGRMKALVELEAEAEIVAEAEPHFEFLPTELLCRIFNYLELKERGIAERVCSRWHSVLTSRDCPLADVVVVNLFEPSVWVDTIAKNRYTTVKGTFVKDFDGLRNVFHHISTAHTAKLWFHTEVFARKCIDMVAEFLDVKCVDVYPYANVHILPYLQKKLPHLSALNMRPHSNQFHACGLQLPSFPDFSKLTTLILDNYGVEADFDLPKTVTSLDYSKREQTHYRALLPKLLHLRNLEYFTLSHADMSLPDDFNAFVRTVSSVHLPKLTILTLRMCKICALTLHEDEVGMNLKMIKFDLCYGNIASSIRDFLSFNPKLSILALNVLCNRESLDIACNVCCELRRRRIGLHLSILQNYPEPKSFESPFLDLKPPTSLFYVLTKFEASFVEDIVLFRTLLMSGTFKVLRECKFVECDALTSGVLQHLSESAPTIRKIGVLSCTKPKDTDVIMFIASISARTTPHLQITWRRDRRIGSLAACYLALVHEHRELIKGKKARFFAKTFSESEEGEEIVIWERETGKSIQIRDYNDHQKYRTLGFIIGVEPVQEDAPTAVMNELMSKLECS
ncbi:hypothetical protein RB195_021284 [Necator americanus]|uniref:F-box domain-containing protein n=1 Tax=Necator americanus TaxID=51031 RepID=A0ABR1EAD8_NECAM